MPELEITIGGRTFFVSCRAGEEHFLNTAAKMLDGEAQPILSQLGRLPEPRMLLMAGLMLADRTASVEDENRVLKARVAELESGTTASPRAEMPEVPQSVTDTLADLAARAEALAAVLEERVA